MLSTYDAQLKELRRNSRRRSLKARTGIDFSSNDYLGMANDPALKRAIREALERGVPAGSGGARLLRGNHPEHEALEDFAARFYNCEASLFMPNGYAANCALIATLPQRQDHIFFDELVHASAHEGMRLARCASSSFAHNDANALEAAIADWRKEGGRGRAWIAIESLYSMDGDAAPIDSFFKIAAREDAFILIDEAHATGIFGSDGRGLSERYARHENIIVLRTLGKAIGVEGALICCAGVLRDFLINRARAFIFSTAPSPLIAAAASAAIALVAKADDRRSALDALRLHAAQRLQRHGVASNGSQILPLVIGDERRTMKLARELQAAGLDVRGIRPPTVPEGTSRLRISLTTNVSLKDVDLLEAALESALS